jgi:MoaA/NifB/PqqE/SkfB family radical SAM enzyme
MYAQEHMDITLARRILSQGYDLGLSAIVVTGGEPLLHEEFFEIPPTMPDVPFMIFTNGSLLPAFLEERVSSPNMLWLVSIDGPREIAEERKGPGSYDVAIKAMKALRKHRRPFGFSVTLAPDNVDIAGTPEFIQPLVDLGCRSGAFLEQIPSPPTDPPLSRRVREALDRCRDVCKIPIVGFPADEDRFGGCQAGGDGLAHVSPDGYLEPCPAARLAADSLAEVSLETAFSSPFIKEFRDLKTRFEQEDQSCAYTGRAETFEAALARFGAHSTV